MQDTLFAELKSLVHEVVKLDCPILSGNMKAYIKIESIGQNEMTISISAPSYDLKKWKKTGVIQHTGEYDYAISVNKLGAFWGRSRKSQYWLNKSLNKACNIVAANNEGVEVVNELEL